MERIFGKADAIDVPDYKISKSTGSSTT